MTRANKALLVMVVAAVGIWGCAQQGSGTGGASAEHPNTKEQDKKLARLEEENKALTSTREELRKNLRTAEEQRARLLREAEQQQNVAKERDELRQQVAARASERDAIQGQFEQLRKALRGVLSQAEAATASPGGPVTSTAPPTMPSSF